MSTSPIKVFITGAANGLAEVREGLADHPDVELVGTAADPAKAGAKLAESSAQVILHGTTATDHVPTGEIEAIRGVTAAPIVLVTSASANAILSEALAAGIFDVVLLPQLTDGIVFTIKKANSLAAGRGSSATSKGASTIDGKTVTLFSPKGGAGKTVLASNLACVFARHQGKRTLLLDLDLQFGDAAIMMGIEPEKTIYDLVMARRELDSDALAGYVTAHQSGVHVLPAPMRPEDAELVTEERLGHLFSVAKECYDVIVVDTPPFFHGPVLATLDRTDQLLLVASLDVPAIKNIKLTMQTLDLLHYPAERRHLLAEPLRFQGGAEAAGDRARPRHQGRVRGAAGSRGRRRRQPRRPDRALGSQVPRGEGAGRGGRRPGSGIRARPRMAASPRASS